jgi:hypothetical protein
MCTRLQPETFVTAAAPPCLADLRRQAPNSKRSVPQIHLKCLIDRTDISDGMGMEGDPCPTHLCADMEPTQTLEGNLLNPIAPLPFVAETAQKRFGTAVRVC